MTARTCLFFLHTDENLSQNLTLNDVSRVSGISVFHLHRLFQLYTGEPLAGYLRRQRVSRGMKEIAHGSSRSVIEIAIDLGYENTSAFIRAFKKRFVITPKKNRDFNSSTLRLLIYLSLKLSITHNLAVCGLENFLQKKMEQHRLNLLNQFR